MNSQPLPTINNNDVFVFSTAINPYQPSTPTMINHNQLRINMNQPELLSTIVSRIHLDDQPKSPRTMVMICYDYF